MFQTSIERKLSAMLGAEVTFEKLKLSLLGGSVEATNMTVRADGAADAFLAARKVRAEISVAKALTKQMVVKSLAVEGLTLSIERRADGSLNLPGRTAAPAAEIPSPPRDAGAAVLPPLPTAGQGGSPATAETPASASVDLDVPASAWRMEAQRVVLSDGKLLYRERRAGGGPEYLASADAIAFELRQAGGAVTFTLYSPSLGRRDAPAAVELGALRAEGTFARVTDLANLADAPLRAEVEVGPLKFTVWSDALASKAFTIDGGGAVDLTLPARLAPPSVRVPAQIAAPHFRGRAEFRVAAKLSADDGVEVSKLTLTATDVRLPAR